MYLHNLYCYLWYTWLHMFLFIERHKNHALEGLLGRPPSKPLQPLFLWRYFPRRWILSPLQLFSWKASLFNNVSLRAVVLKLWPRTSSKCLPRELARSAVSGALCRPVGSGVAVGPAVCVPKLENTHCCGARCLQKGLRLLSRAVFWCPKQTPNFLVLKVQPCSPLAPPIPSVEEPSAQRSRALFAQRALGEGCGFTCVPYPPPRPGPIASESDQLWRCDHCSCNWSRGGHTGTRCVPHLAWPLLYMKGNLDTDLHPGRMRCEGGGRDRMQKTASKLGSLGETLPPSPRKEPALPTPPPSCASSFQNWGNQFLCLGCPVCGTSCGSTKKLKPGAFRVNFLLSWPEFWTINFKRTFWAQPICQLGTALQWSKSSMSCWQLFGTHSSQFLRVFKMIFLVSFKWL